MFLITVKELFELIVLQKKKKKKKNSQWVLLFLKAFSWETDLWVMLGDFTVKKCKIGMENLYLTENQLDRTKYGVQKINTAICVTYAQKNF